MDHPRPIRPFRPCPDPGHFEDIERLEQDITELAAHINAATYQLLELIGIYDEERGWAKHGVHSCAHWLQWQCGTNLGAAREKVRVARALPNLPKISAAFREGRISYSKVRAMTRVATRANEDDLMNIAIHGTAAHVETVVRDYRRCKRLELLRQDNQRHASRELAWSVDEHGMWLLKARLTAEQGALIKHALEKAMDSQFQENAAETEASGATHVPDDPIAARRADALECVAESFLSDANGEHSGGDRYLINIQSDMDTLKEVGEGAESRLEDSCHISAETSRRMACDASLIHWHESENGEPLSIGRKSRTIPPAIRRALRRRDGGCRFPGCSCKRFVDAHHIVHWADGGETSLDNLVLLCRRHHRLVHEGGFGVHAGADGGIGFTYPSGEQLPVNRDGRFRGNAAYVTVENFRKGLEITSDTLRSRWDGEHMDRDIAVWGLLSREEFH